MKDVVREIVADCLNDLDPLVDAVRLPKRIWRLEIIPFGNDPRYYTRRLSNDADAFALSLAWNQTKRIEIAEHWSDDLHKVLDYRGDREVCPSITVSADKTPFAIARDIVRRFLPGARALEPTLKARLEAKDEAQKAIDTRARELAQILGIEVSEKDAYGNSHHQGNRRLHVYGSHQGRISAEIDVTSTGVNITRFSVSDELPAFVTDLCNLIAKYNNVK